MNQGYVFDLNGIIDEEDLRIPFLKDLYFNKFDLKDLEVSKIRQIRDKVMANVPTNIVVNRHVFFFVIKYDQKYVAALSKCISSIQKEEHLFNAGNCEIHVVCNFMDDGSFNAEAYEQNMPCMNDHRVCVYSWFLGQYDNNGDKPISKERRAHAILRMVKMVCEHHEVKNALSPWTTTTEKPLPIYNIFGDASVFFDEEKRTKSVRNYYCFKSIQHLLNLTDVSIDEYIKTNLVPCGDDPKEIEKRIDATAESFLKQQRSPIEASLITKETQNLLLKSSEDDKEYLVNSTDNKLVFLNKMSKIDGWQLQEMETFLTNYQSEVNPDDAVQGEVSNRFLDELYNKKYIVHERNGFDSINNTISESRKKQVDLFKQLVDKHLNGFLDQHGEGSYVSLHEILTQEETSGHRANLDYGIAFLEYLESGGCENLIDEEIAKGDICFKAIKKDLEEEKDTRFQAYEARKKEIEDKYKAKDDEEPSKAKEEFEAIDLNISQCLKEKKRCDFDLQYLINADSEKKLTSMARALVAVGSGILAAIVWMILSIKWLSGLMNEFIIHYGRLQWGIFRAFILAGIIVGAVIFIKAWRRRKEAIRALEDARQRKKEFMGDCVNDMMEVTKLHHSYLLAYHGLKTLRELIVYSGWKKEDIVDFRKTMFKLMLQYKTAADVQIGPTWNDDNTIELLDPLKANTLLFGPENQRNSIPYCFGQDGIVLSDTFVEFKRKKARWETTRDTLSLSHTTSYNYDPTELENEVIPCMKKHANEGLVYSTLDEASILPVDDKGVEMDDVHQGFCGDCYFLASLAAIARKRPDYIIGQNGMVKELGDEHRFFRVRFYDKDGEEVHVDVDNRFWNQGGEPFYAGKGKSDDPEGHSYDPWVMAIEKAWAKANDNGYDGIQGSTEDGKEIERKVEFSFAVTGKSAFYCMTKNVTDSDKLLEMMKEQFNEKGLPITMYSVHEGVNKDADPYLVNYHAYALKSINDDGTLDIFNPWNNHGADENVHGKHYDHVDMKFLMNNFEVVVFFGIQEAEFDSFERVLTDNAPENEVTKGIENILDNSFAKLGLKMCKFKDLLTDEKKQLLLICSSHLLNKNLLHDPRGVEGSEPLLFMEGANPVECDEANEGMTRYLDDNLQKDIILQPMLLRDDDRQCLTLFMLSPHYVLESLS